MPEVNFLVEEPPHEARAAKPPVISIRLVPNLDITNFN